ncbi:MAG TPA: RsmE family RNA methyltransferase [Patescibacteria group bacterium]|nr:RsmE family RNA methyltransferase [Patescibacteria group bacterium]
MSYFLTSELYKKDSSHNITGEEFSHIMLARRHKAGDRIELQDPAGTRFVGAITSVEKKSLTVLCGEKVESPNEPDTNLTLFLPILAQENLTLVLQKSVELGANEIVLTQTDRSQPFSKAKFEDKQPRFEKILTEAAKQCGRTNTPQISYIAFSELSPLLQKFESVIVLNEQGNKDKIPKGTFRALILGPEGGLSPYELDFLKKTPNATHIKISNFTLRAETAAIAGLALAI